MIPKRILIVVIVLGMVLALVTPPITLAAEVNNTSDYTSEDQAKDPATIKDKSNRTTITSTQNVGYEIVFYRQNLTLDVEAENPNDYDVDYAGVVVTVDGSELFESNTTLEPSEQTQWTVNVTKGIDVLKRNHTIVVSTYGDWVQFNFTKKLDSADPGPIPTPYIEDVTIANGTIDGEPSAVAKVTLVNPSIQTYSMSLVVHTLETDGSLYPGSVPPGEKTTITVELLDERGAQIAGEARLYAGNLSKGNGAIDQVGFVGRAGADTKTWNETYEPVKGPWQDDHYQYTNETYEEDRSLAERLSHGYELFGVPVAYYGAALLVGLLLVRRRR